MTGEWGDIAKAVKPRTEIGGQKAVLDHSYHLQHSEDRLRFEEALLVFLRDNGWEDQGLDECALRDLWRHPRHGMLDGFDAVMVTNFLDVYSPGMPALPPAAPR